MQFYKKYLRESYNLPKSLALGESSRCFYLRNSQSDQMNTATHRYNRPICAEEGNQIYKDTIMGQEVGARVSSPAAAASQYCSSVLPFTVFICFDLQETRWCQKKLHFSHYFFASFFSKQQCFFSCATTPFFSTEHLWIRAP